MTTALDRLCAALAPAGLNAIGVLSAAEWDARMPAPQRVGGLVPGARQVVVVGSGGPALWRAFRADLELHPSHLVAEAHPLDAFVRRAVQAAGPALGGVPHRWVLSAANEDIFLDFRVMGEMAGLGTRGKLGLLMHPVHGPWMGLRAACIVAGVVGAPSPALTTSPCDGCSAPCVAACPGAAFPEGRFSIRRCASFHGSSDACALRCHSRRACPEGAASAYPAEEERYHNHRPVGRAALRRHLGIQDCDDPFAGEPLAWERWLPHP